MCVGGVAACLIMHSVSSNGGYSFSVLIGINDEVYFLILGVSEGENSSAVSTDKAPPGVCLCVHLYYTAGFMWGYLCMCAYIVSSVLCVWYFSLWIQQLTFRALTFLLEHTFLIT